MTSPFVTAAVLWWWRIIPPACAGTGLAWGIRWWIRQWRAAGAVIDDAAHAADQAVPYWPADPLDAAIAAVTCRWCAKRPTGRCTCGIACGHRQCPRLSLADLYYLDHGTEMPR